MSLEKEPSCLLLQGLGKTVTGLALILRTKGRLAEAPAGHKTNLVTTSEGKKIGFYLLSPPPIYSRKRALEGSGAFRTTRRGSLDLEAQQKSRMNGLTNGPADTSYMTPDQVLEVPSEMLVRSPTLISLRVTCWAHISPPFVADLKRNCLKCPFFSVMSLDRFTKTSFPDNLPYE